MHADRRPPPWPSPAVGWYVTALLALGYVISFVDRLVIALLVEPIKHDLHLTDARIGLLQGTAFGVVYALAGLPIGRLTDRASRRWIVAVGMIFWSLMTAASGLAASFAGLLVARAGVGIGEAALSPAGLSLISDHFPPERRNRPISVFMLGATIGSGLSIILGGALIAALDPLGSVALPVIGILAPWQMTFVVISLPGFIVAALLLTIREPERRGLIVAASRPPRAGLVHFLWQRRGVYALLIGAISIYAIGSYAAGLWLPTYFIRVFKWHTADVAMFYGPIAPLASGVGMIAGGLLADLLTVRKVRGPHAKLIAGAMALSFVPGVLCTQMATPWASLALVGGFNLCAAMPFGLTVAALMAITPNQYRGQLTAVYLCATSLTGFGLGPLVIGVLNDRSADPAAIRDSMSLLTAIVVPVGALMALLAIGPFARARDAAAAWDPIGPPTKEG